MPGEFRFIPVSLDAFRRAARDLQRAYDFRYQEAQTNLARLYGFSGLHELQQAVKSGTAPPPPPEDGFERLRRASIALRRWRQIAPGALPVKRIGVSELHLFEPPEERRELMDYEWAIDEEISVAMEPVDRKAQPSDYACFEVSREPISGRREGNFVLSRLGKIILEAIYFCLARNDAEAAGVRLNAEGCLRAIAVRHPSNPFATAARGLMLLTAPTLEEGLDGLATFNEARKQFEALMPKRFSGAIVAKLVSVLHPFGVENQLYLDVLRQGAELHLELGNRRKALAWSRRLKALDKDHAMGADLLLRRIAA